MEGIDALNSWNLDLRHKTGNCGPQRPERGQKSIGQSLCTYTVSINVCINFNPIETKDGGVN